MREHLGNFLVDLACNPALMAQFMGDPDTVLSRSGLTEEERALLLTRDSRRLAEALGATSFSLGEIIEVPKPAKKAPGKKKGPKKPPSKKTPSKKTPSKKTSSKKTSSKKTPVRKAPARPARKSR